MDLVETRKDTRDTFLQKLDGKLGLKAAILWGKGPDPKEGTILRIGGRVKTTLDGQNVFHGLSEDETLDGILGRETTDEGKKKLPIANARKASDTWNIA